MIDVTIPSALAGSRAFKAEWDVICTADGAFQFVSSTLVMPGGTDAQSVSRTVDMSTVDRGVNVSVILGNVADSVYIDTVEIFA